MNKLAQTGVCFFAYNNDQLDYINFSVLAAEQVKKHFTKHNNTCLITDEAGEGYLRSVYTEVEIDEIFDYIVTTDTPENQNYRAHYDSPWTEFSAPFKNGNKHEVFWLTPFERTILMDIDYIVQTNALETVFDKDNVNPVQMFKDARYLRYEFPRFKERWLHENGIPMLWSTVVYFDQSDESHLFFDTWAHIADNYDYYKFLYGFESKLFRTDFCVSIASHILDGMQIGDFVTNLPGNQMLNVDQKDDIVESNSADHFVFLAHDRDEPWKNILVKIEKQDIHIMNKRALGRMMDQWEQT